MSSIDRHLTVGAPAPTAALGNVVRMQITRLGHSCLLVETARARVLIDPGVFSSGFEQLTDLDAIVVTHQHPDHLDPERGPQLIAMNRGARLVIEPDTAAAAELADDARFAAGAETTVGDLTISGVGGTHARIHDQVPLVGNVGMVLAEQGGPRLFHPGDSYGEAPAGIDILAIPLTAPWTKISETLDFARAVSAGVAIPIHDGGVNPGGRGIYLTHLAQFSPDATTVVDLDAGEARTF